MKENRTVITGDERTLILLYAILNQGYLLDDAFIMLSLSGIEKDSFLKRTNLSDKLNNFPELIDEIVNQIELLENKRHSNN